MQKTVLLFRHAKSDWHASYDHDHNRPLNSRGKRAAQAMGRWLAKTGPLPELILCSTAVRARSTCILASRSGTWTENVTFKKELYYAAPQNLLKYLQKTADNLQTVMLIGHQPTWSITAELLSNQKIACFPTASMIRIDLNIETWKNAAAGTGNVVWQQLPKKLPKEYYNSRTSVGIAPAGK